ncbi:helicase [Lignoscripta atroalba]|nr:helicase [Lignoscripta atroalba]
MTRGETLTCVHEPFGDAFYYGPERLGDRYENNEKERLESGFSSSTYKTIFERLDKESAEGKRLFIKDMIYYLVPPNGKPASIAPSLARKERGVGTNGISSELQSANGVSSPNDAGGEPNNPTVVPEDILKQFHFTFLIRHPRSSIPSYYRCTIPPLDEVTGFYNFMPSEAGYDELRRVFDYLRSVGQVGPNVAGHNNSTNGHGETNGHATKVDICVIDADDLLDNPNGIIEAYCKSVGLDYDPSMLNWDTEADHQKAKDAFAKWHGFHEDAINSSSLRPRLHKKKVKSRQDEDTEWVEKYGEKGAKIIRETVDANVKDYEYLKGFALQA